MEQADVWCLTQKGNSRVLGCSGSIEMGSKARMGRNVVTDVSYTRGLSGHVSFLTDH
jgi:hypothetical protein